MLRWPALPPSVVFLGLVLFAGLGLALFASPSAHTASDGSSRADPAPATQVSATRVAELAPGWNLVGWTGATAVDDALASIAGQFEAVFTWDAQAQSFRGFRPALPPALNSLAELQRGDGVWILISDAAGALWEQPAFDGGRAVPLAQGFNLVMWTGPNETAVADAVAGIAGNLEGFWIWDPAPQAFLSYTPSAPAFLNSATTLDHGDGVWLRLSHDDVWDQPPPQAAPAFALASDAFAPNTTIPALYTCDDANISPPLSLSNVPAGTESLAIILDDPDAPGGTWTHWVEFDIPVSDAFPANAAPIGASGLGTAGLNSWGLLGYGGPCPPEGTHRYIFTLYALDGALGLAEGASKEAVLAAMEGRVLASAELLGLFR